MGSTNPVSSKVTAAGLAGAVSTLIWFVLTIAKVLPEDTAPALIAGATGATVTVLSVIFGYVIPDENREQGKGVPPPS